MAENSHLKTIRVGDFEMHLSDSGDEAVAEGRQTLLLVHGFPLDRRMWHEQLAPLANFARVIAPDLRGFGKSSSGGQTISMEQLADDLAALLDCLHITEPIVLCGLSMGGYVAFQFWLRHAQRLAGLILCDTRSAADTKEAAANRERVAQQVLEQGSSVISAAMLPKLFHEKTAERNPAAVQLMQETMLGTLPETLAAAQRAMAVRQDVTAKLSEMNLPALVIVGEQDVISPRDEMQALAKKLPRAEFVVVPEAGHMSPLENPAAFNAAVEKFLAKI